MVSVVAKVLVVVMVLAVVKVLVVIMMLYCGYGVELWDVDMLVRIRRLLPALSTMKTIGLPTLE